MEDATGRCANGTPPVNATVNGRAPAGNYTGVAFDVGVPFKSNHGDPTLAGSPLNLTARFSNPWPDGHAAHGRTAAPLGDASSSATAPSRDDPDKPRP